MAYVKSDNTPAIHENLPKRLDWIEDGIANAGGAVQVTDGTHTIAAATEINFTSGATVTDAGGGIADVAISGGVQSVAAADTSIVVAGTSTAPTIKTATLDVIAADHPPAADWSNNSHKITNLANGSAATDAAAFGQIPTSLEGNGDETLFTIAASGASQALNIANGATQDITLTANCTFTFTSPASGSAWYMTLLLRQDATGSRTVTWPTITWLGSGVAPTLQTSASAVDSVVVFTVDGGTHWFGVAQTSASGLKSGTAFPGSPSDGDLFYRTDTRILYEYNSTATRWLSLDRKYLTFVGPDFLEGTSNAGNLSFGRIPVFEDLYIESWQSSILVATTNNASNFYTVTLYKATAGNTSTAVSSFTTASDTVTNNTIHGVSVAGVVAASSFPTMGVKIAATGTPGNHFMTTMLVVRSCG